eukprot:864229-Rhodomonas_salina.3
MPSYRRHMQHLTLTNRMSSLQGGARAEGTPLSGSFQRCVDERCRVLNYRMLCSQALSSMSMRWISSEDR